jgi:hypothetical protein
MIARLVSKQEPSNLKSCMRIQCESDLSPLFEPSTKEPFFCELISDNGYKLLIGIGKRIGCVQYSRIDGVPPYLIALKDTSDGEQGYIEFLIDGTPTPVSMRYCIPLEDVRQIANHFLKTGELDSSFLWEEI